MKLTIAYLFIFSNQMLGIPNVFGQKENIDTTLSPSAEKSVRWVFQYPSEKNENEHKSFGTRLANILVGKMPAEIVKPISIVAYDPENFWILDQGTRDIFQLRNKVGEMARFSKKSDHDFSSLVGLCMFPDSKILFTDSYLNKIFCYSIEDERLCSFSDSLVLSQPTGIAYSSVNKEIYVSETSTHQITVLDGEGNVKRKIGQRGSSPGSFNFPTFIWIDNFGTLYVNDAMNFRVQVFDKNDSLMTTFGQNGDASGYFSRPKGIATDSFGNIYVVDALFHVVQIFDKSGKYLYKFGMQGQKEEEFWMPTGIFIDEKNYIYVADTYNSRIQVFQLKLH